jgi:hypothetical protein
MAGCLGYFVNPNQLRSARTPAITAPPRNIVVKRRVAGPSHGSTSAEGVAFTVASRRARWAWHLIAAQYDKLRSATRRATVGVYRHRGRIRSRLAFLRRAGMQMRARCRSDGWPLRASPFIVHSLSGRRDDDHLRWRGCRLPHLYAHQRRRQGPMRLAHELINA